VVADDPEKRPCLLVREGVTGGPGPVGGFLAFLDPLRRRPALL